MEQIPLSGLSGATGLTEMLWPFIIKEPSLFAAIGKEPGRAVDTEDTQVIEYAHWKVDLSLYLRFRRQLALEPWFNPSHAGSFSGQAYGHSRPPLEAINNLDFQSNVKYTYPYYAAFLLWPETCKVIHAKCPPNLWRLYVGDSEHLVAGFGYAFCPYLSSGEPTMEHVKRTLRGIHQTLFPPEYANHSLTRALAYLQCMHEFIKFMRAPDKRYMTVAAKVSMMVHAHAGMATPLGVVEAIHAVARNTAVNMDY